MDITNENDIKNVINTIIEQDGKIDILINNAGYGLYGPFEKIPIEDAYQQFSTNVFGLANLTKYVIPYMRKQGFGKIINISSIAGSFGEPLGVWYHASKYAVDGISESLRLELKKFNIQVINIKPGPVKTQWEKIALDNLAKYNDDNYNDMINAHIKFYNFLWKFASYPKDIAKIILEAVEKNSPKPVYYAGRGSKTLVVLSKIIPKKIFDSIYLAIYKKIK